MKDQVIPSFCSRDIADWPRAFWPISQETENTRFVQEHEKYELSLKTKFRKN